jgi:hypothetical protein
MGDQQVAKPLPTHRPAKNEKEHTDIHVLSWIQTHVYSIRADGHSS